MSDRTPEEQAQLDAFHAKAHHPVAVWVRKVLAAHGVRVHLMPDASLGAEMPGKWLALVSTLSAGLEALHRGDPLPPLKSDRRTK